MRAVFKALADPDIGKDVHREAQKALDGAVDDLRYFLKTGLRIAQAEDDRVAIARIPADPGISDALREAARKAMDRTPEEPRHFLDVVRYEADGRTPPTSD